MMKMNWTAPKVAVALAAVGSLLSACLKKETFPVEPAITFKSFAQYSDSASFTITFTDGDGDIGLAAGDTFPPYDADPYYNNLFLEYFKLVNGAWVHVDLVTPLHYRIPVITPTGQDKALEGDLAVALPWPVTTSTQGDTVRFSAKLVDRALHESNTVFSGSTVVPL